MSQLSVAHRIPLPRGDRGYDPDRADFDAYLYNRLEVPNLPNRLSDEQAEEIRYKVGQWATRQGLDEPVTAHFGRYSSELVGRKIGALTKHLRQNHPEVPEEELDVTDDFVATAFKMYRGRNDPNRVRDGLHAFVVPVRVSRHDPDYGDEVYPVIPGLRYLPQNLLAHFMVGLPPFVIGTYKQVWGRGDTFAERVKSSRRGILVCAPISADLAYHGGANAPEIALQGVRDAVDYAYKGWGARTIGLGAMLPGMTDLGRAIQTDGEYEGLVVTTGHAGTVDVMGKIARKGVEAGYIPEAALQHQGMIGTGAIGGPGVVALGKMFRGYDPTMHITDVDPAKVRRTAAELEARGIRYKICQNAREVMEAAGVVYVATNGPISSDQLPSDLQDRFIVDDSQPASLDPKEVARRGGTLAWVIGSAQPGSPLERLNYGYGTMHDPDLDSFGCEAEVAALATYRNLLEQEGVSEQVATMFTRHLAVTGPVTPEAVERIGHLFKVIGVGAAELQAFGKLVVPKLTAISA